VHPELVEGTELVEVPAHPEPVELARQWWQGFDRLSPNGEGFVFGSVEFSIILTLRQAQD
jgi:hypothetical protein